MQLNVNLPNMKALGQVIKVILLVCVAIVLSSLIIEAIAYVALPLALIIMLYFSPRMYRGYKEHGSWNKMADEYWETWADHKPRDLPDAEDKEK